MAKAKITTPAGIKVEVEGTSKEITAVVQYLQKESGKQVSTLRRVKGKGSRILLIDLIASLIDGGFFKEPRDLAAIKAALEELGHHYPVTTLSPAMLRLVRKKHLRRIRQNKRWLYTR